MNRITPTSVTLVTLFTLATFGCGGRSEVEDGSYLAPRGVEPEALAQSTTATAARFFGLRIG